MSKERKERTVEILMKPVIPLLEKRMEEIIMMAYDEGHRDGHIAGAARAIKGCLAPGTTEATIRDTAIEQCAKLVGESMAEFERLNMCGPRNAMMEMANKMREMKS